MSHLGALQHHSHGIFAAASGREACRTWLRFLDAVAVLPAPWERRTGRFSGACLSVYALVSPSKTAKPRTESLFEPTSASEMLSKAYFAAHLDMYRAYGSWPGEV